VHIQSGLTPTGNNANSDAEYEAEAKADPAGAKLAFHEGGAKYKPNGDGTYTVVNELNGVYDSNPPHTALVRARTLQEARHLTIEAAIADYINDACSGTFPDDRVHCTKTTAATQSQAASPKPIQARGAAPSDGTCTPAPEWPHMNRCTVSEQVFVDAYVRVNAGRDGLDLAHLKQLGRDEYTMSTGLTGAPTVLLGQYMPTSRGQRAMAYLVYGPYGQRLMRRPEPAPAPQTTAPQWSPSPASEQAAAYQKTLHDAPVPAPQDGQPVITVNQTQPVTWTVTYQGHTATVGSEMDAERVACSFSKDACHGSM
jgi:hypothetical protein